MSKATKTSVIKAFNESVGHSVSWEIKEVKAFDGREQTQLVNGDNGTVVLAVNATGDEALQILQDNVGTTFIDPAFSQPEIDGPNQANQLDKSDNNVKVPASNPGAAVEAEKGPDADKLKEDLE